METKQYGQPRRRKKRRKVPKKRRTGLLIRLRQMSWYNLILVAIVIIGFYLIGIRLYRLWEIYDDMNQTLQQEQTLRDENLRLRERRDKLNDPDEIAREAREQFGLAKPDEIPYTPWFLIFCILMIEFFGIYEYNGCIRLAVMLILQGGN